MPMCSHRKGLTKLQAIIMKRNPNLSIWINLYIIKIHFKVWQASRKGKTNKHNSEKKKVGSRFVFNILVLKAI